MPDAAAKKSTGKRRVIPSAPRRQLVLLGNDSHVPMLAMQRPSDGPRINSNLNRGSAQEEAPRATHSQQRAAAAAPADGSDGDEVPELLRSQTVSFFYMSPTTRRPQLVAAEASQQHFPSHGDHSTAFMTPQDGASTNNNNNNMNDNNTRHDAGGDGVLTPQLTGDNAHMNVEATEVDHLKQFKQRLFEPVELQVESLSTLGVRLMFALWYAMLIAALIVEVLPQAQWDIVNICGQQHRANFKKFDTWSSPCTVVAPSAAGTTGYDVSWLGVDLHHVRDDLKRFRRVVLSVPRPANQVDSVVRYDLYANITYQALWEVESDILAIRVVCEKKKSACDLVRIPEELVLSAEEMSLTLLDVPKSLADAVRGTPPAVGIVFQRRAYTLATAVWRYVFMFLSLLHLLRFVAYRKYTSPLYEQTWVIVLQIALLWYLDPIYALNIVTAPLPIVLAFVEYRIPTYFMAVTIAFMFSVLMASMAWSVSPPSRAQGKDSILQQLERILCRSRTVYDPPLWTKLIAVAYVLLVFALDIIDAYVDDDNWSSSSNSESNFANIYWSVIGLLLFGGVVCLGLLMYLREYLGGKPYLESRPQQLACRVFLAVFSATVAYFVAHCLLFFLLYNYRYPAVMSRQPFLQLPAIMVACGFVNIMTLVYTTRNRDESVPIHPTDRRWKHMVWPDTWYRWLARHGGSQYVFETETEETNFYRTQIAFRKRQWMAKQKRRSRRGGGASSSQHQQHQDPLSPMFSVSQQRAATTNNTIGDTDSSIYLPQRRVSVHLPADYNTPAPQSTVVDMASPPISMAMEGSMNSASYLQQETITPQMLNMDRFSTYFLPQQTFSTAFLQSPAATTLTMTTTASRAQQVGASADSSAYLVVGPARRRSELLERAQQQQQQHMGAHRRTHSDGAVAQFARSTSFSPAAGLPRAATTVLTPLQAHHSRSRSMDPARTHHRTRSDADLGFAATFSGFDARRSAVPVEPQPSQRGGGGGAYGDSDDDEHNNGSTNIVRRTLSRLGRIMGAAERTLIEKPARKLDQLETNLVDALYRPFQSMTYLPFLNLETAIDCYNMSWEAYGMSEEALAAAAAEVAAKAAAAANTNSLTNTSASRHRSLRRRRHTDGGDRKASTSSGMCGCCPVEEESTTSDDTEDTELARVDAARRAEETVNNIVETTGDSSETVRVVATHRDPNNNNNTDVNPSIHSEDAAATAADANTVEVPMPSPPVSPCPSGSGAEDSAAEDAADEGPLPINVEKYGFVPLLVAERKDVQVIIARMDLTAVEHAGKAPRIIIAFRGTANMKNAKYDANIHRVVWREMEKPLKEERSNNASANSSFGASSGSVADKTYLGCANCWRSCIKTPSWRPTCHAGFLSIWRSLKPVVVPKLREILEEDPSIVYRIFTTGHSLGGALASLCAYSVTRELLRMQYAIPDVTVYTYGQPRMGNSTFQGLYNKAVPRSFRIINESDMVVTMTMFGGCHVGIEVNIDRHGNFIVKPTDMERMFAPTKGRGLALMNHLMTNYGASLNAIADKTICPARALGKYVTAEPEEDKEDNENQRLCSSREEEEEEGGH